MSLSPVLSEGRGSSYSSPLIPNELSTLMILLTLMYLLSCLRLIICLRVCTFTAQVFLHFHTGLMFLLLSHIWLQMARGFKKTYGGKHGGNGQRHINSTSTCILFAFHQVKNRMCVYATVSLSHFNICSSSDRTSIETK